MGMVLIFGILMVVDLKRYFVSSNKAIPMNIFIRVDRFVRESLLRERVNIRLRIYSIFII
jgi:hypothetical protein